MSALHANGLKSGTCLVKIIKAQISSKGLNVHVRMLKKLKIFFLLSYLINYLLSFAKAFSFTVMGIGKIVHKDTIVCDRIPGSRYRSSVQVKLLRSRAIQNLIKSP